MKKIQKYKPIKKKIVENLLKPCYTSFNEKKLIKLRKEVNELRFNHHFSKSEIAKKKKVSRKFVIKWTKSKDQDFEEDKRGWSKGKRRKWKKEDEKKIEKIYHQLEKDLSEFYLGATVIEREWRKKYSKISPPPLITIGRILADLNLSKKRKKGKAKGTAKYLCYPEYTIFNKIGQRVLETDFIGKKFIKNRKEPLNFIAFSFKKPPKIRYFKRISGETGEEVIEKAKEFFKKFEKPDVVKMDNSFASAGGGTHQRTITKTIEFFLKEKIIPIFSVPRKPFSQASIEGNNSVFSRKFWNRIEFRSIKEVDQKIEWFNLSSQKYLDYQKPKRKEQKKKKFIPRIYFLRQVKEDKEKKKGFIEILNEKIFLSQSYINLFLLSEWNLKKEKLMIYLEKDQKLNLIKKIQFKIHPKSKERIFEILKK